MNEIYQIRVAGHLADRWSDWLGGLAMERQKDGTTVLSGAVVDQAALHGVIARIRDLGVALLAVDRISDAHPGSETDIEAKCQGGTR